MRQMLKSKIQKAVVTEANVHYEGSITIDEALMQKIGLSEGEQVMVVDNTNGERLVTYAITGEKNSGVVCMNGAAAYKIKKGDEIIIMAFEITDDEIEPKKILVDRNNTFIRNL